MYVLVTISILALYNSRPRDSTCSISDLSQFVRKVGTIQDLYESMQIHLTVANIVTSVTNSKSFGDRWQCERELLEGDNILDSIRDMLYQEVGEGKDSNLVHISRFPSLFGNVFHHQQWN